MKRNLSAIIMVACAVLVVLGVRVYGAEEVERPFFVVFAVQDLRTVKTNPSTEEIKNGFKFFLGSNFVKRESPVSAAVSMAPLGVVKKDGTFNVLYVDKEGERFGKEGLKAWSDKTEMKDEDLQTLEFTSMKSKIFIGINVTYDKQDDAQLAYIGIVIRD